MRGSTIELIVTRVTGLCQYLLKDYQSSRELLNVGETSSLVLLRHLKTMLKHSQPREDFEYLLIIGSTKMLAEISTICCFAWIGKVNMCIDTNIQLIGICLLSVCVSSLSQLSE